MASGAIANEFVRNNNSQFSDLFSLLTSCEIPAKDMSILGYSTENLKIMYQNIRHVVDVLLNGLQNVGDLIAIADRESMNNMGQFISTICNLIDALNTFALDTSYELRQRGVVDY